VIFMAEIAYLTRSIDNPLYNEEMGALDFMKEPGDTLIQALLLKFKPTFMDVLPLYIVLLIGFPPVLWLLLRAPTVALALSVALYTLSWNLGWNLPSYPTGTWYFNPLTWQLIFVFGAWCGLGGVKRLGSFMRSRWVLGIAVAYLLFSFLVVMTWYFPRYAVYIPKWFQDWMYPIDKTNMDVLRFAHFVALAVVTVRFIPADSPYLKSPILKPMILCGQHSLEIFCLGVFLAFAGHFILAEVSGGAVMHAVISLSGILIMWGVAWVISWYKRVADKSGSKTKSAVGSADMAGGG